MLALSAMGPCGPGTRTMQGQRRCMSNSHSLSVRNISRPKLPNQLVPVTSSRGALRLVVHGSKDDLENQLDLTQKTLDRVLAAVQDAQVNQQPPAAATTGLHNGSMLAAREQQLWERQQALMERMQQQWDRERQAWLQREQSLLQEIATLRQEARLLLTLQTQRQQQQSEAAAAAAVPDAASSVAGPGVAASSSGSVDPAYSNSPAAAVICGPSSASAAVAEAICAVRDAHANPPAASSMEDMSPAAAAAASSTGSWQDLLGGSSSSSSAAADSVAAAIAAVDDTDVLLNMDLSFGGSSSSRGRRRAAFDPAAAAGVTSSSDDDSVLSSSPSSSSSTVSSVLTPAAAEAFVSDSVTNTESNSAPVETQKSDPTGPPPLLMLGDDDIYWVSRLHGGLMAAGFYPSDEEVENWVFGEGTQGALLMFQACNDVAETGTTCDASWRKLLGEAEYAAAHAASSNGSSSTAAAAADQQQEVVTYSFSSSSSSSSKGSSWPVLLDMDGGREVHALQVALSKAGYHCGDDEMRWWQFGSSTLDALKTFQACNRLPESGATDERTWLALLGADATPAQLQEMRGDSSYEEDMAAPEEGAVWLLGEQRWSRPSNGTS